MTETSSRATTHRASVDDCERITACECGLQVFTRPGHDMLTNLFITEHEAILSGTVQS